MPLDAENVIFTFISLRILCSRSFKSSSAKVFGNCACILAIRSKIKYYRSKLYIFSSRNFNKSSNDRNTLQIIECCYSLITPFCHLAWYCTKHFEDIEYYITIN